VAACNLVEVDVVVDAEIEEVVVASLEAAPAEEVAAAVEANEREWTREVEGVFRAISPQLSPG
jgi:hypothetical protein